MTASMQATRAQNDLIVTIRAMGRHCHVFPVNPAIDKLLKALTDGAMPQDLRSPEFLKNVEDVVEGLRELLV